MTRRTALLACLPLALLAGCASTVPVEVAPSATDPVCAQVVLSTPDELASLHRADTDAQASTAWGTPQAAIVLRCGVEPLGPTTDRCVTVGTPGGASVDWVTKPDSPNEGDWTFTTYGRVPAVEVVVPAAVRAEHSTSFLADLGPAISQTQKKRSCL
ncbi:DUF3515 family protein [Cellulomonas sp. HZM]|uniref:DUF3515 family protein n=1 Tax=Cellulomonas sp. HZM TaxID=1454010 RepID=UPI000493B1C0|nr:DUF3515 family protein [Cellulomonas sp. HZM]